MNIGQDCEVTPRREQAKGIAVGYVPFSTQPTSQQEDDRTRDKPLKKKTASIAVTGIFAAILPALAAIAADLDRTINFQIPSQSLDSALLEFSRQAGLPLAMRPHASDKIKAPSVKGLLVARAALSRLLVNSGWQYTTVGTAIAVSPMASAPAEQESSAQVTLASDGATRATVEPSAGHSPHNGTTSTDLGEIIVTSRKREERFLDVPVSIAAITADDINQRKLISSQDYLRGIPGVNQVETGYNSGQSIVIRGIESVPSAQNYSGGTTYASYFGESPTTNSAGLTSGTSVDPKLVDIARVEVLRGPQGTAFGDSSLGGAVRVIPVAPGLDASEGRVVADYSNTAETGGNNYSFQAIVNLPLIEDRLAVRAVGYEFKDSGYYQNRAGSDSAFQAGPVAKYGAQASTVDQSDVGESRAYGGRVAALLRATDDLQLGLNFLSQKNEQNGIPLANSGTYQQTLFQVSPAQVIRGQTAGFSDQHLNILNPTGKYTLSWADLVATYSYTTSGGNNAEPYGFLGSNIPVSQAQRGDHREHVGEIRLASHLDGTVNFLVGVFGEKIHDDGRFTFDWFGSGATDTYTPGLVGRVGTATTQREITQKSVFAELYWKFLDGFTLTLGGRYYDYDRSVASQSIGPLVGNSTFYGKAGKKGGSPRINLGYNITADLLAYAGYSEGFRLGTPQAGLTSSVCDKDGNGIVDGTSTTIASTRTLNSDKMRSYEIGIKGMFLEHRLLVDGDIFHMLWSGLPVRVLAPAPPVGCFLSYQANAGNARSDGVELHATYRITNTWRADASSSWVHARLTKDVPALKAFAGDRLPGSPEVNAGVGSQFDFNLGKYKAFVRADAIYVGSSYGDLLESPSIKSDAYTKIDVTTGVSINSIDVSAYIHNLADNDAFVFRGTNAAVPLLYGYRLRPRTVGLELGYRF